MDIWMKGYSTMYLKEESRDKKAFKAWLRAKRGQISQDKANPQHKGESTHPA
jgi:hypothetical protein